VDAPPSVLTGRPGTLASLSCYSSQYAGFDASGTTVQGGYTIHHAEGFDKQFTAWSGQAATVQESVVLGTTYLSNFLETVNQTGNVGPGASGSGLFNQNNHLTLASPRAERQTTGGRQQPSASICQRRSHPMSRPRAPTRTP
jgi:hypothetical protein